MAPYWPALLLAAAALGHRTAPPSAALLEAEATGGAAFPIDRALAPVLAAAGRGGEQRGTARAVAGGYGWAGSEDPMGWQPENSAALPRAPLRGPLSGADSHLLAEVTAKGFFNRKFGRGDIALPVGWMRKIETNSLLVISGDESADSLFEATARLASEPELKVRLAAVRANAPVAARDLHFSRLLGGAEGFPKFFESQSLSGATFLMTEWAGPRTLDMLQDERNFIGKAAPLEEALPLMMDLLQAVAAMERLGVVHGDLSEENIHLVDLDRRALLMNFRRACFADSQDPALGCPKLPVGNELRHAPEMLEGRPTGVSNNVWQLGLVFARLLLGGDVPTAPVVEAKMERRAMAGLADRLMRSWMSKGAPESGSAREMEAWMRSEDASAVVGESQALRSKVRKAIRELFDVQEMQGFETLRDECPELAEVLEGMLAKDPKWRWSAARALSGVGVVAQRRGLSAPAPRGPARAADAWEEDWQ